MPEPQHDAPALAAAGRPRCAGCAHWRPNGACALLDAPATANHTCGAWTGRVTALSTVSTVHGVGHVLDVVALHDRFAAEVALDDGGVVWVPADETVLVAHPGHPDQKAHGRRHVGSGEGSGTVSKATRDQIKAGRGGSAADPVETDDVNEALVLLHEGVHVKLPPVKVATVLDKLAAISQDARSKGKKAPDYDLCKVAVPGTNLFCAETLGVPRAEMPQFAGIPREGSPAAAKVGGDLTKEADMVPEFKAALESRGVNVSPKTVPAESLRATQNELVGAKVAGMMRAMETGAMPEAVANAPILVSRDGYVLDGHHRWAARVGLEFTTGAQVTQNVLEVDMDITELLPLAGQLAYDLGVAPKSAITLAFEPNAA